MPGLFRRPPQPTQRYGRSAQFRSRYYSLILSHGPVAYWRLAESDGATVVVDAIGPNNLGIGAGAPDFGQTGAINADTDTAVSVDPSSYITGTGTTLPTTAANWTLEGWVFGNPTGNGSGGAPTGGGQIFGWGTGTVAGSSRHLIKFNNHIYFWGEVFDLDSGDSFPASQWNHIVITCNGAGLVTIYLNGASIGSGSPALTTTANQTVLIANNRGSAGVGAITATVDDIAVYNYALSLAQVLEHYTLGVVPSTSASAGNAAGTGTANQVRTDIAPNGGHASATGAAHGIAGAIVTNGGVASATGAAGGPAPSLAVNAGHGAATGAAFDATVTTANITNVDAGHAAATGAAQAPSVSIVANAGHAAGTGSAADANISTTDEAPADTATATGVANQPAASISSNGGASAGTGAAGAPSPSLATNTSTGSATGAAHDASVTVTGAAQAAAGHAAATASAYDASVDTGAIVVPSPPHGAALVVGPAQRRIPRIRVKAGVARATARAYDATTDWNDDETVMALLLEVA